MESDTGRPASSLAAEPQTAADSSPESESCCSHCADNLGSSPEGPNSHHSSNKITLPCQDMAAEDAGQQAQTVSTDDASFCCSDCQPHEDIEVAQSEDLLDVMDSVVASQQENTVSTDDTNSCCSDCQPHEDNETIEAVEPENQPNELDLGHSADPEAQSKQAVPASEHIIITGDIDNCPCCFRNRQMVITLYNHPVRRKQKRARRAPGSSQSCCRSACCYSTSIALPLLRNKPIKPTCCLPNASTTSVDSEQPLAPNEPGNDSDPEKELSLVVSGMDCPACTPRVERAMKALEVSNIKVDYLNASAFCTYDSRVIDAETIRAKVHADTGYSCTILNQTTTANVLQLSFKACPNPPTLSQLEALVGDTVTPSPTSTTDFIFELVEGLSRKKVYRIITSSGWTRAQPVHATSNMDAVDKALAREWKTALLRATLLTVVTIPVLVLNWSPHFDNNFVIWGSTSLALSSIVIILGAQHIVRSALRQVFTYQHLDVDVLVTIAVMTSFIYSIVSYGYNVANGQVILNSYFETATLLICLILFGKMIGIYVRVSARAHTRRLVKSAPPENAHILVGGEEVIHTALLDPGDVIRVHPGESFPSDGVVVLGKGDVDESSITGEATPISKTIGSSVLAGTVNLGSQSFNIRLSSPVSGSTLAELERLSWEARSSRMTIDDITDRVASWIIPFALVTASIALLTWTLVFRFGQHKSSGTSVSLALTYAVAIVALSCPCALTWSVPLVMLYARQLCLKKDFILQTSEALHAVRKMTHVVFDKTGTLTTGRLRVVDSVRLIDNFPDTAVASLVYGSTHPVSAAVNRYLSASDDEYGPEKLEQDILDSVENIPGKGIQGSWSGHILRGGSPKWCGVLDQPSIRTMSETGRSIFAVTLDGELFAAFALEDDVRPESGQVIKSLLNNGVKVSILSGDHQRAVDVLCGRLGINKTKVEAKGGCLPSDKRDYIRLASWQSSCAQEVADEADEPTPTTSTKKKDIVMFVGDGSNDAAALAQADIGVTLASGTMPAINAADMIILRGGLQTLLQLKPTSQRTWLTIVAAFGWSLLYNALAIILGSGMLVRVRIEPQWAGLGELASLLPIVIIANTLRFS